MGRGVCVAGVLFCLLAASGLLNEGVAQEQAGKEYTVSLYHVAPGKHLDFLKWQAEREALGKEAGAPAPQWYVHTDGDSWDYLSIVEEPEAARQAELDDKLEVAARRKGLTTGFAAGLEFRQFIASHTDSRALGAFTAQQLVDEASAQ
ncbi:MAG: hypothetical protein H0V09_12140 [Gemmatimonadetes bacterium]|nr:hypothetical protein [Gemmatimonadota bacterium]